MIWSPTFSPSPRSDKTSTVYLKEWARETKDQLFKLVPQLKWTFQLSKVQIQTLFIKNKIRNRTSYQLIKKTFVFPKHYSSLRQVKCWIVCVPPHQLPDQCQGVHAIALVQVFSTNADQREVSYVSAQLHGIVTVLELEYVKKKLCSQHFFENGSCISMACLYLLHVSPQCWIRGPVDFLPVDRHLNPFIKLKNHQTITQVPEENKHTNKLKIHPQIICTQEVRLKTNWDNNMETSLRIWGFSKPGTVYKEGLFLMMVSTFTAIYLNPVLKHLFINLHFCVNSTRNMHQKYSVILLLLLLIIVMEKK